MGFAPGRPSSSNKFSKEFSMSTPQPRRISRRDFLKLTAAGSAAAAGGYALYEFAPWLDYENQAEQVWTLKESDSMRSLIHYATLAPNGHNTQPWKFAIRGNAIEIHPDYSRELPVVDPQHRELWISLGCALENLLTAARASGYAAEVAYPDSTDLIRVNLASDSPQPDPLFDVIPERQNTRSEYDRRPIPASDLDRILSLPIESGVSLRFVTAPNELETLVEYVNQGNLSQYADSAFVDELIEWLRFNKRDALAMMDGLYSACSGNPEVPGWLGRMFVAGTKPGQQADADAKKLRSSSAAVMIASETEDKSTWVRTGQVYERLALQTTALGIKSAFLNQPIEVSELRSQFQSAVGLGAALPQLLVRLGYADALPRSLRRPVDQVLIS
jgi:hypothetical protein